MKKKKVFILLAMLILGITTFLVVKRYIGSKSSESQGGTNDGSGGNTGGSVANSKVFPLKRLSQGAEVRHLQRWLNSTGPYPPYANIDATIQPHNSINVDGIFGPRTEAALKTATGGIYTYVTKAYYDMKNMQNF